MKSELSAFHATGQTRSADTRSRASRGEDEYKAGGGLARFLLDHDIEVIEVDGPTVRSWATWVSFAGVHCGSLPWALLMSTGPGHSPHLRDRRTAVWSHGRRNSYRHRGHT